MFDITGRHIKNSEASTYITFSNFYVSVKLIVVSVALKRVFDKYVTVVFLTDPIKQDIIYVCVWRMFPTFKTCSLQLVVYKGSDQIIVKQITQNGALQIHFWNNRTFLTTGHFWQQDISDNRTFLKQQDIKHFWGELKIKIHNVYWNWTVFLTGLYIQMISFFESISCWPILIQYQTINKFNFQY